MTLLPDTLFGRLLLAVIAPIAVMLLISFALLMRERQALAQRLGGTQAIIDRVVSYTLSVAPLKGGERSATIEAINQQLTAGRRRPPNERDPSPPDGDAPPFDDDFRDGGPRDRVLGGPGGPPDRQVDSPESTQRLETHFLRPVREKLGAACNVNAMRGFSSTSELIDLGLPFLFQSPDVNPRGPQSEDSSLRDERHDRRLYDVSVVCGNAAPLFFRVNVPVSLPGLDTRLVWQLIFLAVFLGAALYIATRRLTAPLVDLQHAAQKIGRTSMAPRLRESGALEIRETVRAFNTMHERLRRYLDGRTRVLAAMSHDLRTPLTRLRLRAESIDDPDLRARLVADIEEMDSLVNHSLGLFRQSDQTEAIVETDIDHLLAALIGEFTLLGKSVSLSGHTQGWLPTRPLALKRAVSNLIDNAVKYGAEARIEVSDGSALTIAIRDRGPGIPESQLEKVFEPFNRLEASRNRDSGGIGLGLSIARESIEQLNGKLTLSNHPDGGLEARITLPRDGTATVG